MIDSHKNQWEIKPLFQGGCIFLHHKQNPTTGCKIVGEQGYSYSFKASPHKLLMYYKGESLQAPLQWRILLDTA